MNLVLYPCTLKQMNDADFLRGKDFMKEQNQTISNMWTVLVIRSWMVLFCMPNPDSPCFIPSRKRKLNMLLAKVSARPYLDIYIYFFFEKSYTIGIHSNWKDTVKQAISVYPFSCFTLGCFFWEYYLHNLLMHLSTFLFGSNILIFCPSFHVVFKHQIYATCCLYESKNKKWHW